MSAHDEGSERHVLVVDDEQSWREILAGRIKQTWLRPEPKVEFADSLDAAIKALASKRWDLVVTDIELTPNYAQKQGLEITRLAIAQGLPLIAVSMTGKTGARGGAEVARRGGHYFDKEEEVAEFIARVRQELSAESESSPAAPTGDEGSVDADTRIWSPEVRIDRGTKTFVLHRKHAAGAESRSIPPEHEPLFFLFFEKVALGVPSDEVEHKDANSKVAFLPEDQKSDKATSFLIKAMYKLNQLLGKTLGPPPNGRPWFENTKGHAYHLNGSITWVIRKRDDEERAPGPDRPGGPRGSPKRIPQRTMEDNTPRREDRLPAQPKRKEREHQDDD
jgi:DNA-binding response OmpR family regulator